MPSCEEQEKDAETVEILSQEFKKVRCTEKDNWLGAINNLEIISILLPPNNLFTSFDINGMISCHYFSSKFVTLGLI